MHSGFQVVNGEQSANRYDIMRGLDVVSVTLIVQRKHILTRANLLLNEREF